MYSVDRLITLLTRIMLCAGGVLLLGIMALTLVNIGMRSMGNGLRGGVEVSGFLGAAALGLCLPWVQKQGGHAMGGLMYEKLPRAVKRVHDVLVPVLCLMLTAAFTRELYEVGLFIYEGMEVVDGWNIPIVYFVAALTAGCAVQALVLLLELSKVVLELFPKGLDQRAMDQRQMDQTRGANMATRTGHGELCHGEKGA